MIKESNNSIKITLPKPQTKWLENTCKKAGITKSEYISWMLVKSATEMLKVLNMKGNLKDEEIQEICKTKWIL